MHRDVSLGRRFGAITLDWLASYLIAIVFFSGPGTFLERTARAGTSPGATGAAGTGGLAPLFAAIRAVFHLIPNLGPSLAPSHIAATRFTRLAG